MTDRPLPEGALPEGDDQSAAAIAGGWERIIDQVEEGIVILDRDWRYRYVNLAAERLLELPRDQMLGGTIEDLFPGWAGSRMHQEYLRAAARERPTEVELLSPIRKRWILNVIYPSPGGVTVYFRDVTARRNVADALRESNEKYRSLFEHSLDGVLLTKPSGEILAANPAACRILGWTEQQLRTLGRQALVDPGDPQLASLLEESHRQGRVRGEHVMRHQDGHLITVEMTSAIFTDRYGEQLTSLAIRDITERRRIERSQQILAELGAVLDPLRDEGSLRDVAALVARPFADLVVFYLAQPNGDLQRVAAATRDPAKAWIAEVLLGLRSTLTPEHPARQVLRDKTPLLRRSVASGDLEKVAESADHLRALHDWRSVLLVPLQVGDSCLGVMGLASATVPFERADIPLALEIGRRCALLIENAHLSRSERRATQARDEVLGIVAHDLRNPLATIMMQAARLKHPHDPAEPRSTQPIDAILRATARMNQLIGDLLDVAQIESGYLKIACARVSPAALLGEALRAQNERIASSAVTLECRADEGLPDVWADWERIFRVLENLISNAIKFTDRGRITLGARASPGEVVFSVADTGSGVAPEEVPRLFDRFWQAQRTHRAGVGLGLAIVAGTVRAHGGRVWVQSVLGAGSTFFFTLPTAVG